MLKVGILALTLASISLAQAGSSGQQPQGGQEADRRNGQTVNTVSRSASAGPLTVARMVRDIRHELITLPYYGVFDWLEGEVRPDGTVVLRGQVVRASTKSDAESRVDDIEGVEQVMNEIEVLPPSPNDDRLRLRLYRTLFNNNSPLFRYAMQAVPPIHIIVNRGRATLKGLVATEGDRRLAYIRARGVPGLFEVRNELLVESQTAR